MAIAVDILHLFPVLAAIDRAHLQTYCNEWQQRPIARECGIAQIIVDDQRNLEILIDVAHARGRKDRPGDVFLPIDQLLGYMVDRHFADGDERRQLHAIIRDARHRWQETGRNYRAIVGRTGTLYLVCKNPECAAEMMSDAQAVAGQRINYGPVDVECLKCGQIFNYDGSDFQLRFPE